jgi:competence protein ComEC
MRFSRERLAATRERVALVRERAALVRERVALVRERVALVRERVARRPWQLALGALAAGLALAPAPEALTIAPVAAALVAATGVALRLAPLALLSAALLIAGCLLGAARIEQIDRPGEALHPGTELAGRAILLTEPRPSRFGWSAELELSDGRSTGARLLARASDELEPPSAPVGAELELAGSVRAPRPASGFDWPAHLRRRGIAWELELASVRPTGRRRGGPSGFVDRLRERAEGAIDSRLPPSRAALVRGMVLGQDERIDPLTRDDFRASGLGHLLAVSGQNVMLLAALALPLLAASGLGPGARIAVLVGLIGVYVPLAGAGPSLQRAGVMGAAGLVALAAARPASRSYALLLAAVVTLALNPRAAADPGWQLSFAAVAGILVIVPLLGRPLSFLPRPLAEGISITVAATLSTAPLMAHHFGSFPLAGLAANVLALPAVPIVMWAGMLLAALGQLPAIPAGAAAADAIGSAADPAVRYLNWLAQRCAELPGATLPLPAGSAASVTAVYAVLAAGVFAARRHKARHHAAATVPGRLAATLRAGPLGTLSRRGRLAVVGGLAALIAAGGALALRPAGPPGMLTVRFLDVGQGDATLIQHPDGTAVLFDAGPPEARTARLVRGAGVRHLSLVVVTHASRDHHGGLPELLDRVPTDVVLDGGDGTRDPAFRAALAAARERGTEVLPARAPMTLQAGGLSIRVLSPGPRPPGPPPDDPNLRAVVALVSAAGFDLLLSADAESEALAPLALPDVDAMKVPHHGSADRGLPDLLSRLRPELAAIEVGEDNDYGHPAPSTLQALARANVPTYRTDRDGTVTLTAAPGGGLAVATER